MSDDRQMVIDSIRSSLPEFCRRNGIVVSGPVLDNLAQWVAGVVPPGMARVTCTGRLPVPDPTPFACACTGRCMSWVRVYDLRDLRDLLADEETP